MGNVAGMAQPLAGVRVLELATDVAGPFAGKLLADFGADVIKAEPPGGDPSRRHGPFPLDPETGVEIDDPEQSALFLHLNANKRSVVVDLDEPADRRLVADLAARSDVVIESFPPGNLDERGLGHSALTEHNPGLVITSVTPFGQTGPYAQYVGTDIVTYAMGGPMYGTGVDEREPVKLGGNVISYQCGNLAATATLAAIEVAEQTGAGTHIDLSMFEAQAGSVDRRVTYLLWYLWSGLVAGRQPPDAVRTLPNGFFPTADGHVLAFTILPWVSRMLDVLENDDLRARFQNPDWLRDDELTDQLQAVLYPWLYEGDKTERSRTAQSCKWAMTPLNPPVDVLNDPHFADRGYFVTADHPVAGRFRQTGAPLRMGDSWQHRLPAPLLDQHGEELRASARSSTSPSASGGDETRAALRAPAIATATSVPELPLKGVRIIDLTVVWAGPSATMHLGDLGAEIIRVENPYVFPPATRGNAPRPDPDLLVDFGPLGGSYPNLDVSGRPWNKHGMWSAQARNKRSCTLDIRRPEGLDAFLQLVDQCDVLIENNSVGTIDKLGIGWDTLHARNPGLIMVRMPPVSLDGPYAGYVGFGASFEALCGLTRIRGYRDDDPTTTSAAFHMDPASGAAGAFAVMCALRRRRARSDGAGEFVELSQSENMMQHIGEYFIDADRTGREHGPAGNRHLCRAPQGCYPCAGDDRWVVISVGSDAEWCGLCRAMGRPDLATDPRFATARDRMANHDELDELLAAWTIDLDHRDVFERCQAERVPAGPVLDEADAYADPHLAARGFFRPQGSEDVGTWDFPGHQWRWTGPDMAWGPICRLGVDNDDILRRIAGLTDAQYAALDEAGHLTLDYLQPDGTPW